MIENKWIKKGNKKNLIKKAYFLFYYLKKLIKILLNKKNIYYNNKN
jgi:hypothetical protein